MTAGDQRHEAVAVGETSGGAAAAARRARRIGGKVATPAGPRPVAAPAGESGAGPRPATSRTEAPPAAVRPAVARRTRPAVPGWLNWAPAAAASVGVVVLAVLLVVWSHGVWWGKDAGGSADSTALRERVLAAAKTCIVDANTYKYTALDSYERKALACTTGQFTDSFRHTIETLVKVRAPQLKASQTAQTNLAGLEAVSPDGRQWTILVFGQLSVVNTDYPKGRTDPFGAQVTMDKVNGRWLMSNETTVSSPVS